MAWNSAVRAVNGKNIPAIVILSILGGMALAAQEWHGPCRARQVHCASAERARVCCGAEPTPQLAGGVGHDHAGAHSADTRESARERALSAVCQVKGA
jgi:hypothetical protein